MAEEVYCPWPVPDVFPDTFKQYVELFRDEVGGGSERKAAAIIGVSNTAFNGWITGHTYPKMDHLVAIAEHLDIYPAYLNAMVEYERSTTPKTKAVWKEVTYKIGKEIGRFASVAAVAITAGLGGPAPAQAGFDISKISVQSAGNTHCVQRRRRKPRTAPGAFLALVARTLGLEPPRTA